MKVENTHFFIHQDKRTYNNNNVCVIFCFAYKYIVFLVRLCIIIRSRAP